jgi:hypothetical protein
MNVQDDERPAIDRLSPAWLKGMETIYPGGLPSLKFPFPLPDEDLPEIQLCLRRDKGHSKQDYNRRNRQSPHLPLLT